MDEPKKNFEPEDYELIEDYPELRPTKIDRTERPSREQNSQDRLERLLSSLERGWKVVILRQQPTWCRGHLETIEYFGEDDEPIDIDYLIRTWGGSRLHLKIHNESGQWLGGGSVSLFSYPPKVRGKILKEEDMIGANIGHAATVIPAVHNQGIDIGKILDILSKKGSGFDAANMVKLIEIAQNRNLAQPAAPPPQQNPMEQMIQMATAFKQMQQIFGGGDFGSGGGGDGDNLAPIAAEVVKALVQKKQSPPSRGALLPPQPQSAPIEKPKPLPSRPKQKTDNGELKTITQLANKISNMDPDDAAGVVFLALDGMDEKKRAAAMQSFLASMNDDAIIDNDETSRDNYGDDDD